MPIYFCVLRARPNSALCLSSSGWTEQLQTTYIPTNGLEVGLELEEYAHRAAAGFGVMPNSGGVVMQSVPIHYLAVTAQTLAVTRAKQAGGSLSDGHDNSDPSDQGAADLEMEQDSRSSAGGFGEDSDNAVTTTLTTIATANAVNLAGDQHSAMGTLSRQQAHAAVQKAQQQHHQVSRGWAASFEAVVARAEILVNALPNPGKVSLSSSAQLRRSGRNRP